MKAVLSKAAQIESLSEELVSAISLLCWLFPLTWKCKNHWPVYFNHF